MYSMHFHRESQNVPPVSLRGVSQIQPYEMVELGVHEYEDVSKYQQETAEYENITPEPLHTEHPHPPPLPSQAVPPSPLTPSSQSPPPSQPTTHGSQGDYAFSECVAYKTTSHMTDPTTATPTVIPTDLEVVYSN